MRFSTDNTDVAIDLDFSNIDIAPDTGRTLTQECSNLTLDTKAATQIWTNVAVTLDTRMQQ